MSTKSTITHGETFHLYTECFDQAQNVWLQLDGCTFECFPQGIRVEIPLAIWEVIRQHTPACFDLASLTDAQLQAEAEKRVEANRAAYRAALAERRATRKAAGKKRKYQFSLSCFYPDARLPHKDHLAIVVTELRKERADQRKLRREIARLSPRRKG